METTSHLQNNGWKKYTNQILIGVSIAASAIMITQNWFVGREMDTLRHRLDVRDAYRIRGLIEAAKVREEAFREMQLQSEQRAAFIQNNGMQLPPELAVTKQYSFQPIEAVLNSDKE